MSSIEINGNGHIVKIRTDEEDKVRFLGLNIRDAVLKYFHENYEYYGSDGFGRTKDIILALSMGGIKTNSKCLKKNIYHVLSYLLKKNEIIKIKRGIWKINPTDKNIERKNIKCN